MVGGEGQGRPGGRGRQSVDAVFLILMGVGGFIMYESYKREDPLAKGLAVLGANSSSSGAPSTTTASGAPATTAQEILGAQVAG
jgi:hypothetical protein